MQIPITRMEHIGDPDPRPPRQLLDTTQYVGQRRTRNHPVLHDVVRADPADRSERRLAPLPEQGSFLGVASTTHLERACRPAQIFNLPEDMLDIEAGTVDLDDEHRARTSSGERGSRTLTRVTTPNSRAAGRHP